MIENTPILSICIPTYNRAKFLYSCLASIFTQIDGNLNVEIIVSNNNSTDNTNEVIQEFTKNSNFRYYTQQENLGAIKNILKLVNEYAKGDFCWIIGDDDFLLQGSLKAILELIASQKDKVDYFYASVNVFDISLYNNYNGRFDTTQYNNSVDINNFKYFNVGKFEELISPDYSVIFLGELMASIFRRTIWMQYNGEFKGEYLETLETTYPHTVIFANTFFGKNAIYIESPLILALDGAREWWDKVSYIYIVHIKSLLDLYKEKGLSKAILSKCYRLYFELTFRFFLVLLLNPKHKYRNKVSLSKYFTFILTNKISFITYIYNALLKRLKKN